MKCKASIKKSYKRGLWQMKAPKHVLYDLSGAHDVLQKCMYFSGIDYRDRDLAHWLNWSDEKYDGCQFELEFRDDGFWHIVDDKIGGKARFTDDFFMYFDTIPDRLFISVVEGGRNIVPMGIQIDD